MKPFDLEEAKAGKKVVTRNGRNVRIVSFDRVGANYPIVALVNSGTTEDTREYTINGLYFITDKEHDLDLFMVDDELEPEAEISDLQKWCIEILPVVQAAANGEEIEIKELGNKWKTKTNATFTSDVEYRIKPKVKMVNGFEVPMHETSALNDNTTYYTPDIHNKTFNTLYWWGDSDDYVFLANGIVYLDTESATKCAKAMLGINPEEE